MKQTSIVKDFNIKLLIANVAMSFIFLVYTYTTDYANFWKTLIEELEKNRFFQGNKEVEPSPTSWAYPFNRLV